MTKQEEIREKVADLIFEITHCRNGESEYCRTRILKYLHSQGVVIKTGQGLPVTDELVSWSDVANAGYTAVEPLI